MMGSGFGSPEREKVMRIWIRALALTMPLAALWPTGINAQQVVVTNGVAIVVPANRVAPALQGAAPAVTPRDIAPNLAMSNATPTIGQQDITPVMPNPGA